MNDDYYDLVSEAEHDEWASSLEVERDEENEREQSYE